MSHFVICINNESNPVSLILGKVYRMLPDGSAEAHGMIRVIDEDKSEPDGYLYPASMFAPIELPEAAEGVLMRSHEQTAWMAGRTVHGNCWLVYFDILGFKNILRNHYAIKTAGLDAFADYHYRDILRKLRDVGKYSPDDVTAIWFSDTFLLFARDDSHRSLVSINQAATHFFEEVISQRWALRGALGIGEFYADLNHGVFLGQALVDAYRYAENQDWIGFIVTRDACAAIRQTDVVLDRWEYVEHDIPFKRRLGDDDGNGLYAYRPDGLWREILLSRIQEMQSHAQNECPEEYESRHKGKYEHTIAFLKAGAPSSEPQTE